MKTVRINKDLGDTVKVNVKTYDDGTVQFTEVTAAKATVRNTHMDAESFLRKLVTALNTVDETPSG